MLSPARARDDSTISKRRIILAALPRLRTQSKADLHGQQRPLTRSDESQAALTEAVGTDPRARVYRSAERSPRRHTVLTPFVADGFPPGGESAGRSELGPERRSGE